MADPEQSGEHQQEQKQEPQQEQKQEQPKQEQKQELQTQPRTEKNSEEKTEFFVPRSKSSIKYEGSAKVSQYDKTEVDDNAIQEATYLSLVDRNIKLENQILNLEDILFQMEETLIGLQRKLVIAEEDVADAQALLQLRETRNQEDKRELLERRAKIDDEKERQNEIDAERRQFDATITILEVQVERTESTKKLEEALKELEILTKEITELTEKNYSLNTETERKAREIIELEKKLTNNVEKSFASRAKNTAELDRMLQIERKRAQESLDYVRDTLKDRIQGLELQLKALDGSDGSRREKKRLERDVKKVTRSIEQGNEQTAANGRSIESLEKQLAIIKGRADKLTVEKSQLEKEGHKLDQQLHSLKSRLEIVNETNAKFHASAPLELSTALEEEANRNNEKK